MAWSAQRRRRSGAIAGRRTGPRMLAAAACLLATMTPALADRALIVGIDQYDDPALTFKLPGASRADSERIHALLTGAMGYPTDVAAAVTFLASDDARFITGQVLAVDGGWTAK